MLTKLILATWTSHYLPHTWLTPASHLTHTWLTPDSYLLPTCLTPASHLCHICLTPASHPPHTCLTPTSHLPHTCQTVRSRQSHQPSYLHTEWLVPKVPEQSVNLHQLYKFPTYLPWVALEFPVNKFLFNVSILFNFSQDFLVQLKGIFQILLPPALWLPYFTPPHCLIRTWI